MNRNGRKRTFRQVRPAKIQISLCILAVRSESSLVAFCIVKDAKCLHADHDCANGLSLCWTRPPPPPPPPPSILYKSIAGRFWPLSYPDGSITSRCRSIKNAYWGAICKKVGFLALRLNRFIITDKGIYFIIFHYILHE